MKPIRLELVDGAILVVYFAFVLGIGFVLKRHMRSSTDFFLSGRSIPAWVTGLAFLSANLGAQEVIGMAASGAKYGIMTSHFYWVGAIPAMVFVGIFMMPFYYGSKARSVPEYLKLRFDEKTRGFNAITFAVMTVFSSGISMYAHGAAAQSDPGLGFQRQRLALRHHRAGLHLVRRPDLRHLQRSAAVLPDRRRVCAARFSRAARCRRLERIANAPGRVATAQHFAPGALTHSWQFMGNAADNPMGVEWFAMLMGLGFVLSFGYWCTDFLVVQRAMAAKSMSAARRTPLIAAVPKMLFPFLVILPGMIAIALTQHHGASGFALPNKPDGSLNYDLVIPLMLRHYFPSGMLGLGLTALMASFMSGMAGNVTAFNTVWTYDIYQAICDRRRRDSHYLWMGRVATVVGIVISVGAAYFAAHFNNIMDMLQLVFAFVNAPLFATFLLGMFWRRTTGHGAFFGLLSGILAAAIHHGLTLPAGALTLVKGGWLGHVLRTYPERNGAEFLDGDRRLDHVFRGHDPDLAGHTTEEIRR